MSSYSFNPAFQFVFLVRSINIQTTKRRRLTLELEFLEHLHQIVRQVRANELSILNGLHAEQRHELLLAYENSLGLAGRLEANELLVGEHEKRQIQDVSGSQCWPIGTRRNNRHIRNRIIHLLNIKNENILKKSRIKVMFVKKSRTA